MKMKTWVIIARILLGFIYLVFGLDYFLHFIPYQPLHTGKPGALVAGLKGTGYIYPMMKMIQILGDCPYFLIDMLPSQRLYFSRSV